ncbi:MAG: enoyl-CoA hydratase/isomerase family protein [Chloroflexota bacterium]|nr:enoyl-CoA hydratase/isomerase family protein [Chloroflexota bacterium]
MNAIDPATSAELLRAFEAFRDDDALWAAVLTGAGDRAFSAGADLVAMAAASARGEAPDLRVPFGGITRKFDCWKPIVAAINGHCLAGGLELALCCDIRIAAGHAQFGLPEVTRAIIPGAGGTQRLLRAIPSAAAMQLLLTGGRFDAQWALRVGLVSEVVAADRLLPRALEIADEICRNGPLAVRAAKEAALRGRETTIEEGLRIENEKGREVIATADAREGPRAFAEKRAPRYEGR